MPQSIAGENWGPGGGGGQSPLVNGKTQYGNYIGA
jgi:hypothetical protein